VDAVARRHHAAEEICVGALAQVDLDQLVAVLGTRIRHDTDAAEHARLVEQRRHDHGKARFGRAGPTRHLARQILGAGDVFVLVVVFEIDLAQARGLGWAAAEIVPAAQLRTRRPALRAAREAAGLRRPGPARGRL